MPSAWGLSWGSSWGSAWGQIGTTSAALYSSTDLARRIKLRLGRPTTDAAFTVSAADDVLYDFLTEAQSRLTLMLASYTPDALWTVPTALVSEDGGYTYGFGDDTDGEAIFALGQFRLYAQRSDIPDTPLEPGVDFVVDGLLLRTPNFTARTYSDGGPWCQYVAPSNVITATTQPTVPKLARPALISGAIAAGAAARVGLDPSMHEDRFLREWADILTALRTQAFAKSGQARTTQRWRSRPFRTL